MAQIMRDYISHFYTENVVLYNLLHHVISKYTLKGQVIKSYTDQSCCPLMKVHNMDFLGNLIGY